MNKARPPLCVIAGPTASGKSALALALAERTNGVIVNADSAQVYRDLRIVSARPGADETARAEHLLYGYRDGALPCSAADWASDARGVIAEVQAQGSLPILVGGTGLYLRTLLDGIAEVPPVNPAIREEVRASSNSDNWARLLALDPEVAGRLHANDTTRIARALEVALSSGKPLRHWQAHRTGGLRAEVRLFGFVYADPPDEWLTTRLEQRFAAMIRDGGVEEVERLLRRALPPTLPVMRAIGVREIAALVRGEADLEQTLAAGTLATRQYAKRQRTWFRHQHLLDGPRVIAPLEGQAFDAVLDRLASDARH